MNQKQKDWFWYYVTFALLTGYILGAVTIWLILGMD